MIEAFAISDRGCVRKNNEDRFLIDEPQGVYLVADGMGGHGHGEVAAELAIQAAHYFLAASRDRFDVTWPFGYDFERSLDENRLITAMQLANRHVWRETSEKPEYAGMGTTLVGMIVAGDRSTIGNVGDSHAYLMRDGAIRQLSLDDSWAGGLVRQGALGEQQARSHSMRNVLTQAIGSHKMLDVHTSEHLLFDGDVVLLASDGVHGVVEPAALRSILYAYRDPRTAAEQIVMSARECGAPDNATCVVLRYSARKVAR